MEEETKEIILLADKLKQKDIITFKEIFNMLEIKYKEQTL